MAIATRLARARDDWHNRYTRTRQFIFHASRATKRICFVVVIRFYVAPFARLLTSFINSTGVIVFAFIVLRTSLITNTVVKTVLRLPFASTMMMYRSHISSNQHGESTLYRFSYLQGAFLQPIHFLNFLEHCFDVSVKVFGILITYPWIQFCLSLSFFSNFNFYYF